MKTNQLALEAINILKGLSYSQLELEDLRSQFANSGTINQSQIFRQIDRRSMNKVTPQDLINFLGVHRIPSNQRQCQYVIWLAGGNDNTLSHSQFLNYVSNGYPQIFKNMTSSVVGGRLQPSDQLLKNGGQRQFAKLIQKQIDYYRSIQQLRHDFVKKNGMQFTKIILQIDKNQKGNISIHQLLNFTHQHGIQFIQQQFQALTRKIRSKSKDYITHKQLLRALSPFEAVSFPTYRKQSNFQKALDYINQQVRLLDIDTNTYATTYEVQDKKSKTGFQRVINEFRDTINLGNNGNTKYFYDKNYFNELKKYKATFYDPNKDLKKRIVNDTVGPQYHDHFFSDYYLYLEERNKNQHYFNKFGKRYTFQNPIAQVLDAKKT